MIGMIGGANELKGVARTISYFHFESITPKLIAEGFNSFYFTNTFNILLANVVKTWFYFTSLKKTSL